MKTDNFDDAIRRKVESINHTFKEEDIDRVHNYVSANKIPVSFWKAYGFGSLIATSVVVISGLLFWNIKQMQEQKVLISKIETLEKNEIQLKANQVEMLKNATASLSNKSENIVTNRELNKIETKETESLSSENSTSVSTSKIISTDIYRSKNTIQSQKKDQAENSDLLALNQEYARENKLRSEKESRDNRKSIKSSDNLNNEQTNLSESEKAKNIASIQPLINENKSTTTTVNNSASEANDSKITKNSVEENNAFDIIDKNETTEIVAADTKTEESANSEISSEVRGKKVLNAANVKKTKRNITPSSVSIAKMEKPKSIMVSSASVATLEKSKNSAGSSNSIAKAERTKSPKAKRHQRNASSPTADDETNVLFKAGKKEPQIAHQAASNEAKKDSLTEQEEPVVVLKNTEVQDSMASSPAIKENSLPMLRPTLNYQVGLGVERTTTQNGLGVFSEMILNKRLGFSAGLKLLVINNEKYSDAGDYRQQRNRNLNDFNAPNLPDTAISNIGIQTTLLQLPLAVTYYHPLKRNFSLLFSLGTDIDLFVTQQLKFERDDNFNDQNKHEDHEIKRTNVMINNVVITAGLQKQWKHFVFQASPYLSPQIRAVEYKKDNIYFGFRIRAFYRF